MVDALQSGYRGIQSGFSSALENVGRVQRGVERGDDGELLAGIIGLSQDRIQVRASAMVVKLAEQLMDETLRAIA